MANWEVCRQLFFYPEEPLNGVSELCHSWKWMSGLPDDQLTPMWERNGMHFYIGEIARLESGEFVILLRWYLRSGAMHMFYYSATMTDVSSWSFFRIIHWLRSRKAWPAD